MSGDDMTVGRFAKELKKDGGWVRHGGLLWKYGATIAVDDDGTWRVTDENPR
jgi:hypothetical protein